MTLLLALLGCGTAEAPPEPAPVEAPAEEPGREPARRPRRQAPPAGGAPDQGDTPDHGDTPAREAPAEGGQGRAGAFAYEGWPGEGIPLVKAARAVDSPLVGRPGGREVGRCTLSAGESLSFERSVVRTEAPGRIRLASERALPPGSVTYGSVSRLSKDQQYGEAEPAPSPLRPDQQVEHLAYRAEGWCLYRVDGAVISTPCFHDRSEEALTSWWIRTACDGSEGWLRLDDRDDLEIGRQL